ncbi:ABC transporter permease [Nonomuraea sp. NEAU-A123]|uniref:ABC transporter permease n=1 Tax=Nonomuraea sp. NEAU-A123 TaxID=2839649 RepID=UPI001BE4D311|nr:ABC transporter permease [Nonomuraea sp. NEAU-A123]MBT2232364.1 ABC transporter permease [Nonomuraea sp. NEAU-A123]
MRQQLPRVLITAGVIVAAALIASLILLASGVAPAAAVSAFWEGTFGNSANAGTTLTQAVPLLLVALGWIVATRAGRLHVGYPGQVIAGGALATAIGLHCGGLPGPLAVLATALAGIAGGALWAGLTAWLWASRGVLEIISSLLLNLVAVQVAAWLVRGPLQGSASQDPQTDNFPLSTIWPSFPGVPGQTLSYDVVLLPICAVIVVLLLSRTVFGFGLRASGGNGEAARWSGIDPKRGGVAAIVISGGFAGLAGAALLFAGTAPWMSDGFEAGVGFNGIAVALLAGNSPIFAILTAIVFASLNVGGTALQATLDVPSSLAEVLQGAVIVLVLLAAVLAGRRRGRTPATQPAAATKSLALVGTEEV